MYKIQKRRTRCLFTLPVDISVWVDGDDFPLSLALMSFPFQTIPAQHNSVTFSALFSIFY